MLRPASAPVVGGLAGQDVVPSTLNTNNSSPSLFSADEQAAFSQVRQPPALLPASNQAVNAGKFNANSSFSFSASSSSNTSASASSAAIQSQFDIGQALRLGAQVVNALNAGGSRNNSMPSSLSAGSLKNAIGRPAFVSKFARPLTSAELTVLSKYDVVIVLDKSGSMDERDCPGGMSRWDWCRDQMMSLTAQISSVFKNGITVALYSSDYDIFRNVDLGYVTRIFGENGPSGGTYTGKVMDAVFTDYFARKASNPATRKLLVQVVTDGDPSDKGALIAAISRASQMINSPGEITVNFLQIGHEEAGARTLAKLDNNMASEGAKFDIVRVEPFSVVEHEGLPRALADAIN